MGEQFRQSQKTEAIGNLAGGIVHDFNNLLTIILGHAELLRDDLPALDPKRDDLEQIAATAQKAADLTRQLLAFSHKQLLQPVVFDLNQSVRAILNLVVNARDAMPRGGHLSIRTELAASKKKNTTASSPAAMCASASRTPAPAWARAGREHPPARAQPLHLVRQRAHG